MSKLKVYLILLSIFSVGCQKFLELKPDKSTFVVSKASELQGMFDHSDTYIQYPVTGLIASDDAYFNTQNFNSVFLQSVKDIHIWAPAADMTEDWSFCYQKIFRMNLILEEAEKLAKGVNAQQVLPIIGAAMFVRAMVNYEIVKLFTPPFHFDGPDSKFGVPLKKSADIEAPTIRASLKGSYQAIMDDLQTCLSMLPDTGLVRTRPGKNAVFALLARIHFDIGNYGQAEKYADSSLAIYSALLAYDDKSQVDLSSSTPFKLFNAEVIYHASSTFDFDYRSLSPDSNLLVSYAPGDLRKRAFFEKIDSTSYRFKGSYTGVFTNFFTGLSTPEVILIRSESRARNGNLWGSLDDLNRLVKKRFPDGTFVPLTAISTQEALEAILAERRKELCFRPGIRWADIRRLNFEANQAITLKRQINGNVYDLAPGDAKYAFQIPLSVVAINNLPQNPR